MAWFLSWGLLRVPDRQGVCAPLYLAGTSFGSATPKNLASYVVQRGVGISRAFGADQMKMWPWHQRGQPLHELERRHHQARGAVAPGGLELQHHLVGRVALHPLVGQRRAGSGTIVLALCGRRPRSARRRAG